MNARAERGFDALLGARRGTLALRSRQDAARYGPGHREVRVLLDQAEALTAFPGHVNAQRVWQPTARTRAASIAWKAGYDQYFAERLRADADATLARPAVNLGARALADALLAATLTQLLDDQLHDTLMSRWWRAVNDPRWTRAVRA